MTDREMLELAAKAAGYRVLDENVEGIDVCFERPGYLPVVIIGWNPRDDDGEAFRLAVELKINIEHAETLGRKPHGVNCWPVGRGDCGHMETDLSDPLAATRRAIVRAAAEIGKGMK